jgi:hypothetical protein
MGLEDFFQKANMRLKEFYQKVKQRGGMLFRQMRQDSFRYSFRRGVLFLLKYYGALILLSVIYKIVFLAVNH